MPKVLRCKHIGPDKHCLFEARGETNEEILEQVAAHAKTEHGIEQVTEELVEAALSKIVEEE